MKLEIKKGFTLVELMVAIAVFSIVMVVAMSALINVIDANKKAQSIKTAINNVNFALESLSKDLRFGSDYACIGETGLLRSDGCSVEGNFGIKYKSSITDENGDTRWVAYFYNEDNKSIGRDVSLVDDGDYEFIDITSQDVDITSMKFYVIDNAQPYVVITLSGEAGVGKTATAFDLQTSVSQRLRTNE
jgi:prepilin-type N-terminal cleavage/methylation domain-containing protein